ncbi:MAG: phytoene desaturase family protein [Smithellaceae bacterium]
MQEKYDAIIIGSGIGGAGIGALLAHDGKKVLLLESGKRLGGRCQTFERDGLLLDIAWHFFVLGEKGPHGEICRRIGKPDAINWKHTTQSLLHIRDNCQKYSRKTMIAAIPEDKQEGFAKMFDAVFTLPDKEIDKLWHIPTSEWVAGYTDDPMARCIMISFVSQYVCVPFDQASTAEFILLFREAMTAKSTGYPVGGNYAVPKPWLEAMVEFGSEVRTNAKVKKIIVKNGTAVGVVLEDGSEYLAPIIISNADIKSTVMDLVGEEHFSASYVTRIKELKFSTHATCIRVLVSEKVTDKDVVIYIPDENNAPFQVTDQMLRGEIPALPAACFSSPTAFDPSMAPEGKQLITGAIGCPPDISGRLEEWKTACMNSVYAVFPEAKGKVEKIIMDPPSLVRGLCGEEGNIIGVGQTVDQIREKRPGIECAVKNLYLCSADTSSHGIGTESAAFCAIETYDLLASK